MGQKYATALFLNTLVSMAASNVVRLPNTISKIP